MDTKKLVLVSLVVASLAGCSDAPLPDDAEAALRHAGACGFRSDHRYTYELGALSDGSPACVFSPASGVVTLLAPHNGSDCHTESATSYPDGVAVEGVGVLLTESLSCRWSGNGKIGTCALSVTGTVDGVACGSRVALTYKQVEAVSW